MRDKPFGGIRLVFVHNPEFLLATVVPDDGHRVLPN
jgi:hypothetical protein